MTYFVPSGMQNINSVNQSRKFQMTDHTLAGLLLQEFKRLPFDHDACYKAVMHV